MEKQVKYVDPFNENKYLKVKIMNIFKNHIIIMVDGHAKTFNYRFEDGDLIIYL